MDIIKTYIPKRYRSKKLVNSISGSGGKTVINSGRSELSPSAFVDSDTFYSMFEYDATNDAIKAKKEFYSIAGITAYGTGTVGGGGGTGVTVYNGLDSTDISLALSAAMGKQLNDTKLNSSAVSAWALASVKPVYAISEITDFPTSMPASDVYSWAKAATKPTYNFSEIGSKPTTLSGYGITDAVSTSILTSHILSSLHLTPEERILWNQTMTDFNNLFTKETIGGVTVIKANYSLYSEGEISAYGSSTATLDTAYVVNKPGNSEILVMSQKAVTELLDIKPNIISGKNLFNINSSENEISKYLNEVLGGISENTNYNVSHLVEVEPNTTYSHHGVRSYAYFSEKNYNSIISNSGGEMSDTSISPSNAR